MLLHLGASWLGQKCPASSAACQVASWQPTLPMSVGPWPQHGVLPGLQHLLPWLLQLVRPRVLLLVLQAMLGSRACF